MISLNYTVVLDILLNEVYRKNMIFDKRPIHIHGTLDDGPVLGVDNTDQISAKYDITRKSKRTFVKPFFNQQYDSLRIEISKRTFRFN